MPGGEQANNHFPIPSPPALKAPSGENMPISSLPEEIFIEIVEILILPYNDQRAPRLNALRLVCRRWDELIQQTSLLWTYIWNGTNNTYVEQALLRSGTLGLKVRVSHWKGVKNRNKERFWSALLPHVNRWEQAELSGVIGDSIPQALAHTAAPRLCSLALDSRRPQVIDGPVPWPLPNLESLKVRNFGFPWTSQQFPSARLKHLYIDLNRKATSLAIDSDLLLVQIFDSLRGFQEVVSLHLTGIPFLGYIPEEKLTPISLPNLEVVSIGSCPRPIECKLLETLHIPKCRVIVIRPWYWGSTIGQVLKALENLASRIGTTEVSNRAVVEVQETPYETHLGCDLKAVDGGGSFMRLRLEVRAHSTYHELLELARPFFHNWASSFGPNTGWDIRVTSDSLECVASMLSAFATHFPMVSTLTVTHPAIPWFVVEPLLVLFDSTGELPFPCLEHLEMWYCKPFARGIFWILAKRVIRRDTTRDGMTPLRMRIKVPRDVDEIERVELAWLGDQVANLTIEETATFLFEYSES